MSCRPSSTPSRSSVATRYLLRLPMSPAENRHLEKQGEGDPRTLAASSATTKELDEAAERMNDGTKPIVPAKRTYRPGIANVYEEPEVFPDTYDQMDVMYGNLGNSIWQRRKELPERNPDEILKFDPKKHQKEFDDSIQWADCPEHLKPRITAILEEYWDVFSKEELKHPIRGFEMNIDVGTAPPIC